MGFFDAFTGEAGRRDIRAGNRDTTKLLTQGATKAAGGIRSGYASGDRQYRNALAQYQGVERDMNRSEATARGDLQPYMTSGAGANTLYANALGVNGVEAQRAFGDNYAASDPFRAQNAQMASDALMKVLNARGMSGSGYAAEAIARQNLERGSQDYQNYLANLSGMSNAGQSAATNAAGITQNFAGQRAGAAGNRANIYQNRGQNMINRGNALADLSYGNAQQLANQRMGYANALAGSRTTGINNLMSLGGLALKASGVGG